MNLLRYTRTIAAGCIATLILAVPASLNAQAALAEAQTPARYAPAIDLTRAVITALMEVSGTPGMSVAVGIDGEIVWAEGFGYADVEQRVPVWEETKFRIGSVSKPVTAAAVGLLVEHGKLDLDAPVQQYVPSFPEKRWPISTRQVAGHLAGIRHYDGDEFLSTRRYDTVAEGLEIFQDDTLLFEPGERFSYSSYGWNVISAVVEGASGESFLSYMQENVFGPLGMVNTIAEYSDSIIPLRTSYYERNEDGSVLNAPFVDNSYKWAGGGFISTPSDLVRFGFAHFGEDFLGEQTIAELWTPQATNAGESTGYGIGWSVGIEDGQVTRAAHGGGSVGGTTGFMTYPQQNAVVAVVGNMSQAPTGGLLTALILEAFLDPESLVSEAPGTDMSGDWECRVPVESGDDVTATFRLGGSPAGYWGRVTWSNETTDRIIHAYSSPEETWFVTVDENSALMKLRFTSIESDEIAGDYRSRGRGELTCRR